MRNIVTSENKAEYDDAYMSRRKREYDKDAQAAEMATSKAQDALSHERAMRAHKQASIYATPPENVEKHLQQARFHAAEKRKMEKLESQRELKQWEENRRKANIIANKKRGLLASSDEERRSGFKSN